MKMNSFINKHVTEEKIDIFGRKIQAKYIFFVLMIVGILVRAVGLSTVPGGLNQDEAFSGYEAYSLLHYGMDSAGYAFPVYFVSWGSGMNVLNSYLMMPFIGIFGVHTWTVRMPQMITACVSLYIFYRLFSRIFNQKQALIGLLILAISPWHIMMARWGLESNLAPGFLLFGLYAFILGTEKSKFYIVSAVCYGLSLYAYATIWPVVPVLLVLQFVYLLWVKKFKFDLNIVIAVAVLIVFALPLLFFLLINKGYMEEIATPFFSIPKLIYMRSSEISFNNVSGNLKNLWSILWNQSDGLLWNATEKFGLYYKGGTIVAIAGFAFCIYRTVRSIIKREFDGHALILIQFIVAFGLGCLVMVNVNRINCIHISMIAFIAIALYQVLNFVSTKFKYGCGLSAAVVAAACVGFVMFSGYYFTDYREEIAPVFHDGLDKAVEYAEEIREDGQTIYVSPIYSYSKILLMSKYPVTEYRETVEYTNYPSAFLSVGSFGHYSFDLSQLWDNGIFIVDKNYGQTMKEYGWNVKIFGETAVFTAP